MKKEFEVLEAEIAKLETEKADLDGKLADPEFFFRRGGVLAWLLMVCAVAFAVWLYRSENVPSRTRRVLFARPRKVGPASFLPSEPIGQGQSAER